MSIGNFEGAREIRAEDLGAIRLSKFVNHIFGATPVLIEVPAEAQTLLLQVESGIWRMRPGNYLGFDFVDGDVSVADDTITAPAPHGLITGDGPYQLNTDGVLPAGLAADTNYFTIAVDSTTVALALSVQAALADVRVDITAAAGGGTHNLGGPIGWAPTASPLATVTDGYSAVSVGDGITLVASAPRQLTVVGFGLTPVLTYWVL